MNIIPLNPVSSSMIASAGYDQTSNTLALEFRDGSIHHFTGVDPQTYKDMLASNSIGKFFHERIKGNDQFGYAKISGGKHL